jgi:hypothetical protein
MTKSERQRFLVVAKHDCVPGHEAPQWKAAHGFSGLANLRHIVATTMTRNCGTSVSLYLLSGKRSRPTNV